MTQAQTGAALALVFVLAGCLFVQEQPFDIQVTNGTAVDWAARLTIRDEQGEPRFDQAVIVSPDELAHWPIPELVGGFVFIVTKGNRTWTDIYNMGRGEYGWTVVVDREGAVCFEYRLDDSSDSVCPTPVGS